MTAPLQIVGGLLLVVMTLLWGGLRAAVRGTTLHGAWLWGWGALAAWGAVWWACTWSGSPASIARAWYVAAVVSLCPLVFVLGARRPISRSWTGFVIVPMLLVLGLPVAASLGTDAGASFEIELPPLLGYLLVLVMGTGNYFGTRFTGPSLVAAAGLALVVAGGSTVWPESWAGPETTRTVAVGLLAWGAFSAFRRSVAVPAAPTSDPESGPEPHSEAASTATDPLPPSSVRAFDSAWIAYRDAYGIVWAKRVMDRVNESLAAAGVDLRLDLDGLGAQQRTDPERPMPDFDAWATADRIARGTLSWLLKRFVDDRWAERHGLVLRATDAEPESEAEPAPTFEPTTDVVRSHVDAPKPETEESRPVEEARG